MLLFSLLANQERTHTLFLAFNIGREAKKAATMTIRPAGVEAARLCMFANWRFPSEKQRTVFVRVTTTWRKCQIFRECIVRSTPFKPRKNARVTAA